MFAQTRTILFAVTMALAIALMPQVHAITSTAVVDGEARSSETAPSQTSDCCDHEASSQECDAPSEPCPEPCDGPCDCPCCIKTLASSPMIVGLIGPAAPPTQPHLAALPSATCPDTIALSVPVQPPIV